MIFVVTVYLFGELPIMQWDTSDGMAPVAVGPASILAQETSDACFDFAQADCPEFTARSMVFGVYCPEFR